MSTSKPQSKHICQHATSHSHDPIIIIAVVVTAAAAVAAAVQQSPARHTAALGFKRL